MRIYEAEDGTWVLFDGVTKHHFATQQEAIRAMALATEQTGEAVVLAAIDKLMPVLRDAFKDLIALRNTWEVNDINTAIATALATQTDVENTPAARLYVLGVVFTELDEFLNRVVPSVGITPNQALNRINWRNYQLPSQEIPTA